MECTCPTELIQLTTCFNSCFERLHTWATEITVPSVPRDVRNMTRSGNTEPAAGRKLIQTLLCADTTSIKRSTGEVSNEHSMPCTTATVFSYNGMTSSHMGLIHLAEVSLGTQKTAPITNCMHKRHKNSSCE
jgi:hypothetical protein